MVIIDYRTFAERLARPAQRWTLHDEVHAEWGFEDPGGDPLQTREGGENLAGAVDASLPVPEALEEWWSRPVNSFLFDPRLYWTHSQWPPAVAAELPGENPFTTPGEDRRLCAFMAEYEYCNTWAYLAAEAHHPDPRVLVNRGDEWVLQAASISEFFLQLTLQRLPGAYGWTLRRARVDEPTLQRIRELYPELGLQPWQELAVDALLYGAPDALVSHARGPGAGDRLLIHARTRPALAAVAEALALTYENKDVEPPTHKPLHRLDLPPAALVPGDTDDRGRWVVEPAPGGTAFPADDALARHQPLHRAPVTAVAETSRPDGTPEVVSGDANGVLRAWPVGGNPRRSAFDRRPSPVTALTAADFPTGPALFAAWAEGLVRAWDRTTGAVADLRLGTGITTIAADPAGRLTVTTADGAAVALRLDLDHLWPTRDMQRRLTAVDWPALWTTRGPAHAVPSLITRAASDDEQLALDAAGQLYKLLVSRSGRLSAAPVAVPFLVDLMLRPGAQAQNIVLMMIADIADTRRGAKKPDEVAAVRAAIPALSHFRDDPRGNIRWAMNEVDRICAAYQD